LLLFLLATSNIVANIDGTKDQRTADDLSAAIDQSFRTGGVVVSDVWSSPARSNNDSGMGTEPFIFGAGHGTTGTRSIYKAACALGFPSVHWESDCRSKKSTVDEERGLQAHAKAVRAWDHITICASSRNVTEACRVEQMARSIAQMKESLSVMINSGGVRSSHDTPYPFLSSYCKDLQQQQGQNVVFMTSERSPDEWSIRRITEHNSSLVCRDFVMPLWRPTHFDEEYGALDLDKCFELAMQRQGDDAPKYIFEVMVSYDFVLKQEVRGNETKLMQLIYNNQMAMKQHQEWAREELKPSYTINVFEMPTRLGIGQLADELEAGIKDKVVVQRQKKLVLYTQGKPKPKWKQKAP